MALVGDYNLALVQVTIGDFRVTGWGESDAATVAPMSDLAESVVSADGGHVAISQINDPRWEATLTVMRGTAAYRLLCEKLQAQQDAALQGAVPALSFQIFDPVSGDKIASRFARFMRWPDLTFSKTVSEAEFMILLPNPAITAGGNIETSA